MGSADGSDHFNLPSNQVGRERRQSIVLKLCPAVFDREISPFDKAAFVQASDERIRHISRFPRRPCAEVANRRDSGLLRERSARPCRRTTNKRDELPPLHRIASSMMTRLHYRRGFTASGRFQRIYRNHMGIAPPIGALIACKGWMLVTKTSLATTPPVASILAPRTVIPSASRSTTPAVRNGSAWSAAPFERSAWGLIIT